MCLSIPARIISIEETNGWRTALVSIGGVERSVDVSLTPQAVLGDFVVTHSGFAISVLDHDRAVETEKMLGLDHS